MPMTPTRPTTPTITALDSSSILLANTNIDVSAPLTALASTITNAEVYIWIWSGSQNAPPSAPTYIMAADRLIAGDDYINFNIDGDLKSYLEGISFQYNGIYSNASISDVGKFVHIACNCSTDNEATWAYQSGKSYFVTLGYNKTYSEQMVNDRQNDKLYSLNIPKYIVQNFDFKSTSLQTSSNIVKTDILTPSNPIVNREQTLLIFLNSLGLWEMFTCFGKVVSTEKVDKETYSKSFRKPQSININTIFGSQNTAIKVDGSYLVATGQVPTASNDIIAEIIYSPFVYLVRFDGTFGSIGGVAGVTIDSTIITVDSTAFTMDNLAVPAGTSEIYKGFIQIPVQSNTDSFIKKTDVNDRSEKDYVLSFKETFSRIKNIR